MSILQRGNKSSLFFLLYVLTVSFTHLALAESPETKVAAQDSSQTEAYIIGPQNLIQIKIFGEPGVNPVFRVDELGFITHPLVGRVKLAGSTVAEAEKIMESKLSGDYIINPQVTLFVIEHSHFSVLGEVKRPGTYEILGRVSVIEAISMAGGFTPVANQRDVKVLKKGQSSGSNTISVDATRITQQGDRSAEIYIEADDVIAVSKSFF